jgi:hypothetical protein
MDKQLLIDQIGGLKVRLKALEADRDLLLKAQGLDEQAEVARKKAEDLKEGVERQKAQIQIHKDKINSVMSTSTGALEAKMSTILPSGKPVFHISADGDVFIGWIKPDEIAPVPYTGLSGGERVPFNQALLFALGGTVLIEEAAEADAANLSKILLKLGASDVQCVVNSWSAPKEIPLEWTVVEVK